MVDRPRPCRKTIPTCGALIVLTSLLFQACGGGSSGGGSAVDHTTDWIGSYVGTGDVYNAVNGITDVGIPVRLEAIRQDTNVLKLELSYDWDGFTYEAFLTDVVDSTDHMRAQVQAGVLRETMIIDRSGSQVVGTYHQEDQVTTSGNYELIRTLSFDGSR